MKKLITLTHSSVIYLIIGFIVISLSCRKETENYSIQDLLGTWEFVAFGASDGSLRPVQKYAYYPEDCYTITFYEDSTMTGRSTINTLAKAFILSGNHISFPWGVLSTEFGELGDSQAFTDSLLDVSSFKIENSQLKLFYTGDRFLLFEFRKP
jgi:hypothetical protein